MRSCRVCGKNNVETKTGPATCQECRREKALEVKRRYQQSERGKATARAREEREDVKAKRREFSRSPQGRLNKVKYEATEKGKGTRKKAILKYQSTEKARQSRAAYYERMKNDPSRLAVVQRANVRYALSEKMKAKKRRDYARRKAAVVAERPVTAEDWLEIVRQHKNRCHYCGKKRVLTLDHVIPLSKGGLHVIENIVPACRSCNSKKKDKMILLC